MCWSTFQHSSRALRAQGTDGVFFIPKTVRKQLSQGLPLFLWFLFKGILKAFLSGSFLSFFKAALKENDRVMHGFLHIHSILFPWKLSNREPCKEHFLLKTSLKAFLQVSLQGFSWEGTNCPYVFLYFSLRHHLTTRIGDP